MGSGYFHPHPARPATAVEFPPRSAEFAENGVVLTPSAQEERRSVRSTRSGLEEGGAAHLLDAAEMIVLEWGAVSPSTIAHCSIKARTLCAAHSSELARVQGEYRASYLSVAEYVAGKLTLLRGSTLEEHALSRACDVERRAGLENWLEAEGNQAVNFRTAELAAEGEYPSERDEEEDPSSARE